MSLELNFARLVTAFERIADALETNIARGALPVVEAKPAAQRKAPPKAAEPEQTITGPEVAAEPEPQPEPAGDIPTDRESVKAAAMSLASGPAGPAILKELFIEAGSAEGKFNSIPDSGLAGLAVRIAELKAA